MAGRTNRFAATFSLAVFSAAGAASAQIPELPEGWLESVVNERGDNCIPHDVAHADVDRLLIACGAAGVWEIKLEEPAPRFVRTHDFGGMAYGFLEEEGGGRLWVMLQVEEARPFDGPSGPISPPSAPPPRPAPASPKAVPAPAPAPARAAPAPAPAPRAERRVGRVVSVQPGFVVISLGAADGISRSDRVELSLEHKEAWTAAEVVLSKKVLAIGVVVDVTEHHAKVRLGINEEVPVGAVAIPTRASSTASLSGPPRVAGVWELEFMARPFVALGELGGGLLLSGGISRRLEQNLRFGAYIDPLGIGDVESQESVGTANGAAFVSFDTQYLEMGLGLGAQTVNETAFGLDPGSGLTVAQLVRLGARDGLNVSARTSIVLFHKEFDFGGMVASAQIPLTRGYWLLLGGGGGNVGYGYGELGLRVLMAGSGGAGSGFLTATAGGAAVFRSEICTETDFTFDCEPDAGYGGPMVGLGYEWRF